MAIVGINSVSFKVIPMCRLEWELYELIKSA